ncbi:serine acetyltransferase [Enterobacter sp. R1(2018)]|uniref:serine acetyltransferase n=1 Tax=Enterobacter sp. R1(2018) TaxID=2447891 RepID=UPI000EB0DF38|nr:serine acetyltransferase [Enterobacter sp. R1(2018)]RKQ38157.1 serine acetyltransferase [Enterobacter sp. R1(2018)]
MSEQRTKYEQLTHALAADILKNRKAFTWRRVILRCIKQPQHRYIFWWRIASFLYSTDKAFWKARARKINYALIRKYNIEIMLGAKIGEGIRLPHLVGIVINPYCVIGKNVRIRQNTTIGIKTDDGHSNLLIGDNVDIGANCCIIGNDLIIGNNVVIGAMSFVNKNIPDNAVCYTEKTTKMIIKGQ